MAFAHSPVDEEICSEVLEERNTTEECEAPAPPRVAWGNNSTEKDSTWTRVCAGVRRAWEAGKRVFQNNETEVCAFVPSQEPPHTPTVPSRPKRRSFRSLYEVVKELKCRGDRSDCMGIRKSDSKLVMISFFKKSQPEKLVRLNGFPKPLSRDVAALLLLQKPPKSDHIVRIHDMFVRADQDILVLEYPHNAMTLYEYVQRNRGCLTEYVVKHIIRQLIVALQHCMDHGIHHDTHMKNVLIYPNSLKVKLMDFSGALLLAEKRADEPVLNAAVRKYAEWAAVDDIRKLLDGLVPRISRWFWQLSYLSKECLDLLEELNDRGSRFTLETILHHDLFKTPLKKRKTFPFSVFQRP